ncbi:microtubule-destabilizing protein 60-like [Primulina tabacum]|uniref:microtubule-destabilizing protein 60-like n=1 Tax=Primulina tabacum TaxID=48773 RepID=UPI003F591B5B
MESPNRKSAQKIKESTKPVEFRLHTQQRAVHRSIFNSSVAIKLCIMERQKKQVEKLLKKIEEEEVRMMRRNMIPRAQLMPLFDKPFSPQRSTRPLTIPREPSFIKNYSQVLYL